MTEQLKLAVTYNDESIARVFLLLDPFCRINVNACAGPRDLSLLQAAVNHDNESIARMLLERGADVDAMCKDGLTALHIAIANRSVIIVELLLEFKVNVNPKRKFQGKTPLYLAVEYGCLEIAEMLLMNGASVKDSMIGNTSVLHVALRIEEPRLARLLLKHTPKEYIDLQDNVDGKTPLHLAIERQYHDIVNILLKKGANVEQVCQNSGNEICVPLGLAVKCKDGKMTALLLKYGAKKLAEDCLHEAIKQRCRAVVAELLKSKIVSADHVDKNGLNALQIAVIIGYRDMVEVCLEHGASVTTAYGNKIPLLYHAIKKGDVEIAKLLIKNGASVHESVTKNITLLDVAVKSCNFDMVRLLLKHGSVINIETSAKEQVFAIKYMAILIAEGHEVSYKNHKLVQDNSLWKQLYEKCLIEIQHMKEEKVHGDVTFFNVLIEDEDTLATYASNDEFLKNFARGLYTKKFRIYADNLTQNFTRGRVRNLLVMKAKRDFQRLGLQSAYSQHVLRLLSNEDLKSFIKGVCSCKPVTTVYTQHRCLPRLYVAF